MAKWLSSDGTKYLLEKLAAVLNNKANINHNHNDLYYDRSEIDTKLKAITSGGTVDFSGNTTYPLTIKFNTGSTEGTDLFTFNGSVNKIVDITPNSIGAIPWKISDNKKSIEGVLCVGDSDNSKNGRIIVRKNSTTNIQSSYTNYNDAFYSAYTAQEYALIMLTPAIYKNESGKASQTGYLGIHQHQNGLYVGYQNLDTAKYPFLSLKLLDGNGDSDFLKRSETIDVSGPDSLSTSYSSTAEEGSWRYKIVSGSMLSWWNGAYAKTASNLAYCKQGAFGTIVTKNTGDYLSTTGGDVTGILRAKDGGRISVLKNSTIDFQASYTNYNDAFYTAYTEQEYALIMLTPAHVKNSDGEVKTTGTFGFHQHQSAFYVGYQNANGKKESFVAYKLIDGNGNSDYLLSKNLAKASGKRNSYFDTAGKDVNAWNDKPISGSALSYWDGSWGTSKDGKSQYSNLTYCSKGEFGSGATRNISHGTNAPSGTAKEGDIYIQLS